MINNLLRRAAIASAMVVPMATIMSQGAWASKDNFSVENNNRSAMVELYVSDSTRPTWDNNVLSQPLDRGSNTRISFGDSSPDICLYDIRAVFANGQALEAFQVNVCTSDRYTFSN